MHNHMRKQGNQAEAGQKFTVLQQHYHAMHQMLLEHPSYPDKRLN